MLAPAPVIWITGLSGSGKTTIADGLVTQLRRDKRVGTPVVLLDGDRMRSVLGVERSHAPEDRRALAFVYARLCRELSSQGVTVVCATISMFEDVRAWNRAHIPGYLEVYLDVPLSVRAERDPKGLYESNQSKGAMVEDGGGYELPTNPHIIISNHGDWY